MPHSVQKLTLSVDEAGRVLGIGRNTLARKLKRYGLS